MVTKTRRKRYIVYTAFVVHAARRVDTYNTSKYRAIVLGTKGNNIHTRQQSRHIGEREKGYSRVMIRPASQISRPSRYHGPGQVGSGGVRSGRVESGLQNLTGRAGSTLHRSDLPRPARRDPIREQA